jgi:hypothetical protein
MATSPDLVDYLAFFEAEPRLITPGTEWYYGTEFVSVRGAEKIIATIAPDDCEFSFKWWHENKLQADVKLASVSDWIIENNKGLERLILKFNEPKLPYFILQLKPHIFITWVVTWS